MKLSLWVGSFLVVSFLSAQQRGMYGGISTGRVVGSITDPGFASRLGATVSGLPQTSGAAVFPHGPQFSPSAISGQPGYRGGGGAQHWRGGRNRTVAVPFGIPLYYGGGFGYGGGYVDSNMAPQPTQTIVQQVQPSPSVIINQYYTPEVVRPQIREYSDLPEPAKPENAEGPVRVYPPPARREAEAPKVVDPSPANREDQKATITLLAFTDSSVVAVIGYWTQGDTLHYVTSSFAKKTVPAATLDKSLTEQLNRERKVEFKLESLR